MAHFTFLMEGLNKITPPPHLTYWLLVVCIFTIFSQTVKAQNGTACNDAIPLNTCNTNIAISNYETWLSFTATDSVYQLTFPTPIDTPRAHIVSIEIYQGVCGAISLKQSFSSGHNINLSDTFIVNNLKPNASYFIKLIKGLAPPTCRICTMVDTSYFGVCASPLQILIPPYSHTLLLCNNGNVLAMGSNQELQLGLPTPQNFSSNLLSFPAPVVAVAHGAGHSLVLLNDGRVMAWGGNNMGQLGNGTNTNSHIPVFVANICNAKAIAAGNRFSLALLSDGTVMGWGDNSSGQLGIAGGNSPLPINGLANIVQLDAGVQHSIFKRTNFYIRF